MKAQLICNGKTVEVEVSDEQFEKLFVEKKTGYDRSKKVDHIGVLDMMEALHGLVITMIIIMIRFIRMPTTFQMKQ